MENGKSIFRINDKEPTISPIHELGLSVGLLANIWGEFYVNSLETGGINKEKRKYIEYMPQIKKNITIDDMLNFLRNEGYRSSFELLAPLILTTNNLEELELKIKEKYPHVQKMVDNSININNFLKIVKKDNRIKIDETEIRKNIIGWDMDLLVNLSRLAFENKLISKSQAWNNITFAAQMIIKNYHTWDEVGKSILLGSSCTITEEKHLLKSITYYLIAIESKESPWRKRPLSSYKSLLTI